MPAPLPVMVTTSMVAPSASLGQSLPSGWRTGDERGRRSISPVRTAAKTRPWSAGPRSRRLSEGAAQENEPTVCPGSVRPQKRRRGRPRPRNRSSSDLVSEELRRALERALRQRASPPAPGEDLLAPLQVLLEVSVEYAHQLRVEGDHEEEGRPTARPPRQPGIGCRTTPRCSTAARRASRLS